jgi:hypothetical protein
VGLFRALKGHTSHEVHTHRARRSRVTLLLVGVVPLALAACGSTSANGSATTTTKPTGTASEAAYTACLKQHGVTLPNFTHGSTPGGTRPRFTPGSGSFPGAGAGGFRNNPAFTKAAAACKSLRPSGGFGGFGPGGSGGFNSAAFAAYRNCLKLHGVSLPTTFGRGSAGSTPTTTIPSAAYQAAMAACAALRPTPSTTTTTG